MEPRLHQPDEALRAVCETAIRNYDPCISCSAHFLKLTVERALRSARVLGLGNRLRRDDGVGPWVAA